ncbi:MAG: SH3 domain-containing protein [Thermodesulfobacteriota bacterium]
MTLLDKPQLRLLVCCFSLGLVLCSCGGAPTPAPSPPAQAVETYYYLGTMELQLKSQPDPSSADVALVKLNERLQSLKRQGSWFLVRTAAGKEGWANERYLKLNPISDFYVRRWGLRLREAPQSRAKTVDRLRLNDQVKLLEQNNEGWARITNSRSQKTGWLEMQYLSTDKTVVRRRYRKPGKAEPGTPDAGEPPEEAEPAAPAPGGVLSPAPAQAAPPPKAPTHRKQRPELFEPF